MIEGEFEATKEVTKENKEKTEENLMKEFINNTSNSLHRKTLNKLGTNTGGAEDTPSENTLSPTKPKPEVGVSILNNKIAKNKHTLFISLYGKGYLIGKLFLMKFIKIGDNDTFFQRTHYTTSVKCSSTTGKVYSISNLELLRRIRYREDSMTKLKLSALDKDKDINKKIDTKQEFINKSQQILSDYMAYQQITDMNGNFAAEFSSPPKRNKSRRTAYAKHGRGQSQAVSANQNMLMSKRKSMAFGLFSPDLDKDKEPTGIGYAAVREETRASRFLSPETSDDPANELPRSK